jgi:hypothetical protein
MLGADISGGLPVDDGADRRAWMCRAASPDGATCMNWNLLVSKSDSSRAGSVAVLSISRPSHTSERYGPGEMTTLRRQ